jgi:hypothetical protein
MPSRTQWLPAYVPAFLFLSFSQLTRTTVERTSSTLPDDGKKTIFLLSVLTTPEKTVSMGCAYWRSFGPYKGINTDNEHVLDLHGFGVRKVSQSRLQFFVINHRPPTTPGGLLKQDVAAVRDNSTIEVFELEGGSSKLQFNKTIADKRMISPNDLAWVAEGYVLVTNDHLTKC